MLGQLCGSVIFSQPRNALSRHSRSHAGSPFLDEISRMMSSFSPRGATSDSISVTNPYLYALLTSVSTDELMRSPLEKEHSAPQPVPDTRKRDNRSGCVVPVGPRRRAPRQETWLRRRRSRETVQQPDESRNCARLMWLC